MFSCFLRANGGCKYIGAVLRYVKVTRLDKPAVLSEIDIKKLNTRNVYK